MQPDSLLIRLNQAKTLVADITFFEGPGLNCCKPKPKKKGQTIVSTHLGSFSLAFLQRCNLALIKGSSIRA